MDENPMFEALLEEYQNKSAVLKDVISQLVINQVVAISLQLQVVKEDIPWRCTLQSQRSIPRQSNSLG